MVIEAGETVGSVVLREKIADGGMGSVWAAEQIGLGRDVAVKFLATRIVGNSEAMQRFTLEARLLARIQSPHTPQIFDYGVRDDGTPYIVMELINGIELKEWVTARGNMSVEQVGRLVKQVTQALTAAHDLGIVHRDVKPENIILCGDAEDFQVKLIDFGIAKSQLTRAGAITHVGVTLGTPSYMSPEQILGASNLDGRTDIWSLTVVAYWCLTGTLPFDANTPGAAYLAIHEHALTPVTELRPDLPDWLRGWCERGLARDAADRFESAAQMSRMFEEGISEVRAPAEENEPILLVRSNAVAHLSLEAQLRAPIPGRRHYARPVAAIAAVLAIAVGVGTRFVPETLSLGHAAGGREQEAATAVTKWVSSTLGAWDPPSDASRGPSRADRRRP